MSSFGATLTAKYYKPWYMHGGNLKRNPVEANRKGDCATGKVFWQKRIGNACGGTAVVRDIDRDGVQEVIMPTFLPGGVLWCFVGSSGALKWSVAGGNFYQTPVLKDVNNDGFCEILHGEEFRNFYCRDYTGSILWTFVQGGGSQDYKAASPAVTDVDKDGVDEVLLSHGNGYFYCLNALTGTKKWEYPTGKTWYSSPSVFDIDGDGVREILVTSWDPNMCYCFRPNGTVKWSTLLGFNYPWAAPTIDDVDGDGQLEVLLTDNSGVIYILSSQGVLKYSFQSGGGSASEVVTSMGVPILDVDGDGVKEFFIPSRQGVGLYTYRGQKWYKPLPVGLISNWAGVMGDFDNDGRYEIFFGSDSQYLFLLDALTGQEKWKLYVGPLPSDMSCVTRYGVSVADVDGDGLVELIAGVGGMSGSPNASSIIVFKG